MRFFGRHSNRSDDEHPNFVTFLSSKSEFLMKVSNKVMLYQCNGRRKNLFNVIVPNVKKIAAPVEIVKMIWIVQKN